MNKTSLIIALTGFSLSAHATLNFSMPADTGISLSLSGSVAEDMGITGYLNYDPNAADGGHLVETVVLNAPVSPPGPGSRVLTANYYISGRSSGPLPDGATDDAKVTASNNMNNTSVFVGGNAINLADITFRFGTTNVDTRNSWNLGADTINNEWYGDMTSTIEERVYSANSAESFTSLYYQGTEIISFGYSDIYEILDYGPTDADGDDVIQAYSDPVAAAKADGLGGIASGLADAILADIAAGGGQVQLRFDTAQRISDFTPYAVGADVLIASQFDFGGTIQVVPEPSTYAALLGSIALLAVAYNRRKSQL